jgi:UbiD family decarboxylase
VGRIEQQGIWNDYDRPHADLREAIERLEAAGELRRIRGASWNLEMGALAEIVYREPHPPAILFEDIPGYPKGFRALSGATNSAKRLALLLGFPAPSHPLDVVKAYRDRMKVHRPVPPRVVEVGPVLQNVVKDKIDVLRFPAPLLHEQDGGR